MRRHFEGQGFVEVEPAALQASPGNEAHLHGFSTSMIGPDGRARPAYLHTSPEFAMKKLLAAGETRIFALARVFRNRERGALHAPEFTMLEWYRVGAPLEALMEDCAARPGARGARGGRDTLLLSRPRGRPVRRPRTPRPCARLSSGTPASTSSTRCRARGAANRTAICWRARPRQSGCASPPTTRWSDVFSRILSEQVEPRLGLGRPTFLTEYPACEAALARLCPHDPRVAERFELYVCGVELANAFGELTDADEQRRRFEDGHGASSSASTARPIRSTRTFSPRCAHMPEASGAALGFDRLVMLACGAERIEDVQWTPVFDPAEGGR